MFPSIEKVALAFALSLIVLVGAKQAFADDKLGVPADTRPVPKEFPLSVKLLGYIQQSGSSTALIQIGDEKFTLRQSIDLTVTIAGATDASSIKFDKIDHDNRSLLLAFGGAFQSKTCRMQGD